MKPLVTDYKCSSSTQKLSNFEKICDFNARAAGILEQ